MKDSSFKSETYYIPENFEKKRQKNLLELILLKTTNKDTNEKKEYNQEQILKSLYIAKREIEEARNNFELAIGDEMVDYFTYKIKAAEIKYQHLLKLAKKNI